MSALSAGPVVRSPVSALNSRIVGVSSSLTNTLFRAAPVKTMPSKSGPPLGNVTAWTAVAELMAPLAEKATSNTTIRRF